jgi:hypothetical protein
MCCFGSRATVDFGLERNELQLFDCLPIADAIISVLDLQSYVIYVLNNPYWVRQIVS